MKRSNKTATISTLTNLLQQEKETSEDLRHQVAALQRQKRVLEMTLSEVKSDRAMLIAENERIKQKVAAQPKRLNPFEGWS